MEGISRAPSASRAASDIIKKQNEINASIIDMARNAEDRLLEKLTNKEEEIVALKKVVAKLELELAELRQKAPSSSPTLSE